MAPVICGQIPGPGTDGACHDGRVFGVYHGSSSSDLSRGGIHDKGRQGLPEQEEGREGRRGLAAKVSVSLVQDEIADVQTEGGTECGNDEVTGCAPRGVGRREQDARIPEDSSRVMKKSLAGEFGASARQILNLRAAPKLADSEPRRTFSAAC